MKQRVSLAIIGDSDVWVCGMAEREKRRAYIVHRVRIGDHVPSSIKTAAAGLLRGRNVVAIGREDGQIEVRRKCMVGMRLLRWL